MVTESISGQLVIIQIEGRFPMKSLLKTMALTAIFVTSLTPASAQEVADHIWSGGPIITMHDKAMRAEAVAEAGGRRERT